jgi:hypothetical protein
VGSHRSSVGGAMAPMCDEGFGPSMGALCTPRAGGKQDYGERSGKTPRIERDAK